jgi:hypothetical protein
VLDNNAILIQQDAPGYDHVRQTDDIRVTYNTVINHDTGGHFLRVNGSATNLVVSHNLYVAPKLTGDGDDEGGLIVNDDDLSGFDEIEGNVWPRPAGN